MSLDNSSTSLIPFLNHDILVHIFHFNTDKSETERGFRDWDLNKDNWEKEDVLSGKPKHWHDNSELGTIRHASQVCRSWRQIILQSPTIWANIIDLWSLNNGSEYWVKEVLKRTGQANLSIYGPVASGRNFRMFLPLLEENWHRVRRLNILLFGYDMEGIGPQLQRPAPNLETFIAQVHMHHYLDPKTVKDLELFAGSAPLLRRIHSPPFCFDVCASWTSQLISMTLSAPLSVADSLSVMARTALLQSLVIEKVVDDPENWTQNIHLPNLCRLEISSDIFSSYVFLSHITPRSDCALILAMRVFSATLQNSGINLQRLSTIVLGYAEGYFKVHSPTELEICVKKRRVEISFGPNDEAIYFGHPEFKISLRLRDNIYGRGTVPMLDHESVNILLTTIIPSALKTIQVFQFTLTHPSWCPSTNETIDMFREIISVKTMVLNHLALNALNNLPDPSSLFPSLTGVTIDYESMEEYPNQKLRNFLNLRKDAGTPLQTVYIPSYAKPEGDDHWTFLQEFEGLQVDSTKEGFDDYDYSDESDYDIEERYFSNNGGPY